MRKIGLFVAMLVIISSVAFAGGSPDVDESESGAVSVGVFVADSFGDRAFYDIALDGISIIEEKYGVETNQYEGRLDPENFELLLSTAARQNELNFVLGFEAIDALLNVAQNADSMFVFIDAVLDSPDVASVGYKDHEGTALAGALAGLLTTDTSVDFINSDKFIGYIGGVDAPVMQRAIWGYEQGAHYIDPSITVESIFVGSWVDPAKGKEANLALLERGSDINFQYAGLTGEGGFNAAKEGAPMWVIGGGFDQRWMAPDNTIASVIKAVDVTMDVMTGMFLDGELEPGDTFNWGVKERGMYLTMSEDIIPQEYIDAVMELEEKIQSGEVVITEFRD